ncbi:hypothetical protein ACA910_004877 [Epithemia clementina (nom. ined.)]
MWSAIKSDLNEFVSTVAGDTSEVLNRLDQNFPDGADEHEELSLAAEERLRRMEMRETFDSPLISEDDDEDYKKDVSEYLANFSVEERTEEISKLLEENPDTLKVVFESLVPTKVKYEDFWHRYFYRCDEDRISAEIEEDERKAEAARASAFKSISAVGSLFGGAVKAVSASLTEDDKADPSKKKTGSGFFGTSNRPPFVLNTAESEEEEEEEELGWDDDDDGEDNGEDDDDDDGEGQIEFNDVATEKLRDQLKLATEERDQLQQTVEMQMKEIASLKKPGAENSEIEKLKTQLFEKESELAALRASTLDNSGVVGDSPSDADAKIETLLQKIQGLERKADEDKNALEESRKEKENLVSKIAAIESASKKLEEEALLLKKENSILKNNVSDAEKRLQSLDDESRRADDHKDDPGETPSVDSPDTGSSGVKVENAKAADDWDDDW